MTHKIEMFNMIFKFFQLGPIILGQQCHGGVSASAAEPESIGAAFQEAFRPIMHPYIAAPNSGINRVLTRPASGHLANWRNTAEGGLL